MLVTAMDLRVKAAVVSGALNVMQERIGLRYSCGAQVIPGLLKHGDTPELGSLIAPRPCIWEIGSDDAGSCTQGDAPEASLSEAGSGERVCERIHGVDGNAPQDCTCSIPKFVGSRRTGNI